MGWIILAVISCLICPQIGIPAIVIGIVAGVIKVCVDLKAEKEQAVKTEERRKERERLAQEEADKREAARKQWEATEKERREKLWQLQKNFYIIDQMDGDDFERFVAELLRRYGFQNVAVTRASGDYGVDVIAYKGDTKCAIQCKRYSGKLGLKPIQEVHTGMKHYGAGVGIVVTNSYFTENAKRLAKETGVLLWDRQSVNYIINEVEKAGCTTQIAEAEETEQESTEEVCLTEKSELTEDFEMAKIGAGKYVFGEDLPLGKYDLRVVSGDGEIRIQTKSEADKGGEDFDVIYFGEDDDNASSYHGLSLPNGWWFTIDGNVVVEITKSKMLVID